MKQVLVILGALVVVLLVYVIVLTYTMAHPASAQYPCDRGSVYGPIDPPLVFVPPPTMPIMQPPWPGGFNPAAVCDQTGRCW